MAIVEFCFDKNREIENIWKAVNSKSKLANFTKNIKPELIYLAEDRSLEESKENIENFNQKIYESSLVQELPEVLDKSWEKIEPHFVKRLERITRKQFKRRFVKGYLTTISKCPYNPRESWFMVSLFNSIPGCMLTTAHEMFHLHIHDYFFDSLKADVGEEKAHDIKEAVTTTILNLEFRDLWVVEDKGYEKHTRLRKFIEQEWNENHDFSQILEKCLALVKKF